MFVVSLWPIERAHHPFVLRGHSGQVEDLAFAPDGSWLASFANDGTVRRWPMAAKPRPAASAPRLGTPGREDDRVAGHVADGGFVVTTAGEDVRPYGARRRLGPLQLRRLRAAGASRAVGPQGRLVAVAPAAQETVSSSGCGIVDVGTIANVDLGQGGSSVCDWLADLAFRLDGRLLVAFKGTAAAARPRHRREDHPRRGELFEITSARGGDVVLSRPDVDRLGVTTVRDLASGTEIQLTSHGGRVTSIALDREGAIAVTGSEDGVVRVGPVTGEEPHWLVGPRGDVESVAVSPDGRWIASGHADGAIRLWPMPDLTKPPLHGLPHAELLARLKSLTNLRVVRDPDDRESFVVRAEPLPGWRSVPEW